MKQLYTSWGEKLREEVKVGKEDLAVLTEYPRPSMMRDSYENLNGWWDYAITKQLDGEKIPDIYNGKILVPYSPVWSISCNRMNISGIIENLYWIEKNWIKGCVCSYILVRWIRQHMSMWTEKK